MKILVISREGNSLDMALRLKREGNAVKFSLPDVRPADKDYLAHFGEGLVDMVPDYLAAAKTSDLVVFDDSSLEDQMHEVKLLGVPCFGTAWLNPDASKTSKWELGGKKFRAHQAANILERERAVVHDLMNTLKVGRPVESLSFKDIGEAIAHLKDHPVPHVIKPEAEGSGGAKTYVSELEDGRDGIGWLEALPSRADAKGIKSIEVEEKIFGVEVACSLWSNGRKFLGPLNVNFEHKRLWPGNIGVNTGEAGTTMFYDRRPHERIRIFRETLAKLGPALFALDYRGQIDVNGIVNKDGFYPVELTPRLGYPSSYIEPELQITPWGELFYAIARGETIDNQVRPGWATGVVVYGEDYPLYGSGFETCNGLPFFPETTAGLTEILEHFHPVDVRVERGRVLMNGCYAGCMTAHGETIKDCQREIYGKLGAKDPVFFPGMAYRNDIGDTTNYDLEQLRVWGYDFVI